MTRVTADAAQAARALADGHVVGLPTETVYGLGARADDPHAIARVFATKGRPADHPLIVHVSDLPAAQAWSTSMPDYAVALADAFWPGPLTLVVPRSARALDAVTGGQHTVAVRVPSHPAFAAVLRALGDVTGDAAIGIAAPSANRFGKVSPTTAEHVVDELGAFLHDGDLVLDGGPSAVGIESTIVDCTGPAPVVLRPGAVTVDDIRRTCGVEPGLSSTVRAPGTLDSHYAPRAHVVLMPPESYASLRAVAPLAGRDMDAPDAPAADTGAMGDMTDTDTEVLIGVLAIADLPTVAGAVRLAAPADAGEYAQVLYAALRQADALGLAQVIAVPPAGDGVAVAVRDRLARAAHGR